MCKLRPATALLALYGTLHQERRMNIYNSFSNKKHVVLFATDIAARGLDFPDVNWVVQLDCPEDANTYIHRAGRTARYQSGGESLLVLLPSEKEAMLAHLEEKKIPINEIKVHPMKLISPQVKMEAFLAKDPNLKATAQRAFVAYFKAVFLMKDKKVFNVNALSPDTYARSLGLVVCPRLRFLDKHNKTKVARSLNESEDNSNTLQKSQEVIKGKETYDFGGGSSDSEEDDFLQIKRQNHTLDGVTSDEDEQKEVLQQLNSKSKKKPITKATLAKKVLKKNIVANKKVVFTETGEALENHLKERTTEEGRQYEAADEGGIDIEEAKKVMKAEDKIDRQLFREKNKAKRLEGKIKEKKKIKKQEEEDNVKAYSDSEASEPDLSWLPDPDKIYGKQDTETSDRHDSDTDGDKSIDRPVKPLKKRKPQKEISKPNKRLKINQDNDPLDTGLSLQEDEELVLKFLSNNR